jgi:hypothetical protein
MEKRGRLTKIKATTKIHLAGLSKKCFLRQTIK